VTDRVMVVTGAFGALGRAVTAAAVTAGWRVAGLDQAAPPDAAALVGPRGMAEGGIDLADSAAAAAIFQRVKDRLGRIDALVNIAGAFRWETLEAGSPETWAFLFRVNLMTAANASRAALPHLVASGAGAIVNIGAGAALKSGAGMGAYAASKSGVHRLTESLAEELKGKVTVNAVLPSTIDTPANRKDMPDADFAKWVTPAEIADVILFLVSEKARGVTGALIPVNGRV
jgi:NAD(P)-dependent dehydrogenase (short-subunit alcohol dehydrogenase family)